MEFSRVIFPSAFRHLPYVIRAIRCFCHSEQTPPRKGDPTKRKMHGVQALDGTTIFLHPLKIYVINSNAWLSFTAMLVKLILFPTPQEKY